MAQENAWEREYKNPKLLTKDNNPQSDTVRFTKFLKENNFSLDGKRMLDLGSGTGRNSYYFAELGAKVVGLEISKTAIRQAEETLKSSMQSSNTAFDIKYLHQSMGEKLTFDDNSFDIVIDVTSSNSLNESEREVYINEINRVLVPGGYFFLKALCKDGDTNAKNLIKLFPGEEHDTYIMNDLGLVERVWTKVDLVNYYGRFFDILKLEKKTNYSRMNNRNYKRNFWICYMKKKHFD